MQTALMVQSDHRDRKDLLDLLDLWDPLVQMAQSDHKGLLELMVP